MFTQCLHKNPPASRSPPDPRPVIQPSAQPELRSCPAFTLVELIAVIAVLAILLLVGANLFGGSGAQARKTATDQLMGMIEQARTQAITSRSYGILAIAEPGDLGDDGVTRCRIGVFTASEWPEDEGGVVECTMNGRWRMVENGVVLLGGKVGEIDNAMDAPELTLKFTTREERQVQVHALVFNPRGGLHRPMGSQSVAMRVAEGTYRRDEAVPFARGDSKTIAENRLKIGRVTARPYRID